MYLQYFEVLSKQMVKCISSHIREKEYFYFSTSWNTLTAHLLIWRRVIFLSVSSARRMSRSIRVFAFPFGHVLQLYAQALRVTSQPHWGSSEYHEALKSLLFYRGLHPARTFLSLSNIRPCRSTSSPLFEYGCFIKCEWRDAHLGIWVREDLIFERSFESF